MNRPYDLFPLEEFLLETPVHPWNKTEATAARSQGIHPNIGILLLFQINLLWPASDKGGWEWRETAKSYFKVFYWILDRVLLGNGSSTAATMLQRAGLR